MLGLRNLLFYPLLFRLSFCCLPFALSICISASISYLPIFWHLHNNPAVSQMFLLKSYWKHPHINTLAFFLRLNFSLNCSIWHQSVCFSLEMLFFFFFQASHLCPLPFIVSGSDVHPSSFEVLFNSSAL